MSFFKRHSLTIVMLAVLLAYFAYANITGTCPVAALTGQNKEYALAGLPSPKWEMTTLDGTPMKAADLNGKVAVLNFWTTYCPNCAAESPEFSKVSAEYADKGEAVQFLGISLDLNASNEDIRATAEKWGINYPVLRGTSEVAGLFGGIRAVPATFIIAPDGTVKEEHKGKLDEHDLRESINALLPEVAKYTEVQEMFEGH